LGTIGVPGSAIGIILGVDRLLDMCRTVLNVTGDVTIAACVAASEAPDEAGGSENDLDVVSA
jgi:DAACS family dicarboxylate/amino acid:cation (Na+ or H+) symporter